MPGGPKATFSPWHKKKVKIAHWLSSSVGISILCRYDDLRHNIFSGTSVTSATLFGIA
jgi:hypothetical protein